MLKKVFHFLAGRFTSKNRGISLNTNVIYSGCCQCVFYIYAKCFISSTSAIELITKNKLAAPPKFMFCFRCYHHLIFWKFVTLILMGTKCYLFFDCTGRSAKEGGKERKKKEKLDTLIKNSFILAQVSTKNTGRSVSLLVLNSISYVEENVSFLRSGQSS